jgi:hypothetical protein
MNFPFPGMDPYLEHPALLPGVHTRLLVWIAHQLGPLRAGRDAYLAKQQATLASACHFVEIDLLRRGRHVLSIPETLLQNAPPCEYSVSVNRWPQRTRFEFYPCRLRDRLPRIWLPLAEPDPDQPLDIQADLEQVYDDGSYMLRVKYDEACEPSLDTADQQWAYERWGAYRAARTDLFPKASD